MRMIKILSLLLGLGLVFCIPLLLAEGEGGSSFPALKDFHETLALIWHTQLPAQDYGAIRQTAPALVEKMKNLQAANLPDDFASRKAVYQEKLKLLSAAVDKLAVAAKGTDNQALAKAVTDMHTAYHDLVVALYGKTLGK